MNKPFDAFCCASAWKNQTWIQRWRYSFCTSGFQRHSIQTAPGAGLEEGHLWAACQGMLSTTTAPPRSAKKQRWRRVNMAGKSQQSGFTHTKTFREGTSSIFKTQLHKIWKWKSFSPSASSSLEDVSQHVRENPAVAFIPITSNRLWSSRLIYFRSHRFEVLCLLTNSEHKPVMILFKSK